MIFAFAAGLLATVNPCGFVMLPAYLSLFLGLEDGSGSRRSAVGRALKVGFTMSAGFAAVFGSAGLIIRLGGEAVEAVVADGVAWVALITGAGVVTLGVWMFMGYTLVVPIPGFRVETRRAGSGTMFAFGVSYALASLSCAFPIFAGVVASSFGRSVPAGVGHFTAYAAGMAAVLMVVTVALALGRDALVGRVRRLSRRFERISGAVLVAAGAFIVFYWTLILSAGDDALSDNATTAWLERVQARLTDLIGRVPLWLWVPALLVPLGAAAAYALGAGSGRSRRSAKGPGVWAPD